VRPRPIANPPNPWESTALEWLGEPPPARPQVYRDATRQILSRNDSPDVPFTWSVNPYRGCAHACAYCYARPTHEYLGFGAGTDFDTRITVKLRAAELLRAAFERPSWRCETVAFSGATDPYQPLEASYRLTRACLAVCAEYRSPVAVITKAPLVERDLDLLAALHRSARVRVPSPSSSTRSGPAPSSPGRPRRRAGSSPWSGSPGPGRWRSAWRRSSGQRREIPRAAAAAAAAPAAPAGCCACRARPGRLRGAAAAALPERADRISRDPRDAGRRLSDARFACAGGAGTAPRPSPPSSISPPGGSVSRPGVRRRARDDLRRPPEAALPAGRQTVT
jgi:hypothetical protein